VTQDLTGAIADVAVVIVTLDRSDCIRRCLTDLTRQEPQPREIVVVDASVGDATRDVVSEFPQAVYLRHVDGAGKMTTSRNIGLRHTAAAVVAFIDDDAFVHPGWLAALVEAFGPGVGAVGGRAVQGYPGEEAAGMDTIGRILADGTISGYFSADPGRCIDVDHNIGCNMAFTRGVLRRLGGLRDDYKGTAVREETDLCLRVTALGERIIFAPGAVVTHAAAPQARGRRFDLRYDYFGQRNHCQLLLRNFGLKDPRLARYLRITLKAAASGAKARLREGKPGAAVLRFAVVAAGTVTGTVAGLRIIMTDGRDPVRRDAAGQELSALLADVGEA
jgi:GT2 family glycosyltransferase